LEESMRGLAKDGTPSLKRPGKTGSAIWQRVPCPDI